VFAHFGMFIEQKGWSLGGIEDDQLLAQHFDPTSAHIGVAGTFRSQSHKAGNLQDELAAHALGQGEALFRIGGEHNLGYAITVTQSEEDHPAMVTTPVHPATQGDLLPEVLFVQLSTIMAAHTLVPFLFDDVSGPVIPVPV